MSSKPASARKNDEDKGRVELLSELRWLRDQNARQREIISKFKNTCPDELFNDFVAHRELIEGLRSELSYRQNDIHSQQENPAARIQEAIIKSERDFRAIVTKNADAMVVLDGDGRVQYVNPAAEALFNQPASEMAGKLFGFPLMLDEPVEMYVLRELKAFVAVEMRLVEVDWDDSPSYLISLRDMTDRVRAEQMLSQAKSEVEESLRRSEANLAHAQLIAHIGSWSWDIKEDRAEWSDECYRILGYAPGTVYPLTYETFLDRVHPEDRELVNNTVQASLTGVKRYSIDFRIVRPDGTCSYVHNVGEVMNDEECRPVKIFGVIQDITERKRIEESLGEIEARYRDLVENANSIIVRSDRNGKIVFINRFAQRFFGYTEDEIVGKNALGTIIPVSDSAGKNLEAMLDDLLRHPEEYRSNVHENMRKNGDLVWVSWTNKAIYDDKGKMAGLLSIGNDITRLKHAEKALEESKMQAELYLDLMGHDINNIHQIALGYLEMAREMIEVDDGQKEYLDKPIEVLQRSAQLISNVRKMQKLMEGYYYTRTMDVCEVLADVRMEYSAIPHKPVRLDYNGIAHCNVLANDLLFDLFSNLVANAIKHTGDRANIYINLDLVEENDKSYCRVSVEDDGPGISDDFKSVIFNRMLKSTAKAKGMGLGLFLVKSLVSSYGGLVWVEDRVKGDYTKGAKFVVMLPAA